MAYVTKNIADKAGINTGKVLEGYDLDNKEPIVVEVSTLQGTITGASGSFTTVDGKTVTVVDGIITTIV